MRVPWPLSQTNIVYSQIEFAFIHAKDEDGVLAGLDMMSRQEAVKKLVRTHCDHACIAH